MNTETRKEYCNKCEHQLDTNGHCPKHWPPKLRTLTEYRRQLVNNRVATKTSIAEDLLTVLDSPISNTVIRLLDALAGLTTTADAAKGKNLEQSRRRPQHAPTPNFHPAWADQLQTHADERLWELTVELESFLNRPRDPKTQSACTTCGNRRIGEASYCQNCGTRILEGARRCRLSGCPNEGHRRANCPDLPH